MELDAVAEREGPLQPIGCRRPFFRQVGLEVALFVGLHQGVVDVAGNLEGRSGHCLVRVEAIGVGGDTDGERAAAAGP